jgi:DNA primase
MALYTKESLELLRQRIDLAEALSGHVQLRRSGSSYKALCPFHEEKTPSFVIQKGDTHYHCYGCGAHGDAIAFLMAHVKLSFTEAVESLAERFGVVLEKTEVENERQGPSKSELKEALEKACRFYHFMLLHSEEGQEALKYLYKRGIDLDFVRLFQIGYAPYEREVFQKFMRSENVRDEVLEQAGLILMTEGGRKRDFFSQRITFPIRDPMGSVIGFSARKFKEETYGGKYINTPETPLFKKSQVLFGLSYCRKRIAKERRAIIVEGQIDALRLVQAGFNFTVAGQGTAFGEGHVRELLNLGVHHVFLALDADEAGLEAAVKIGGLFQKKGVEVSVVRLPVGKDPDSLLREDGPNAFLKLLEEGIDYLTFLVERVSKTVNIDSPSGKNELVQTIARRIKEWEQPVMVHESLRKLAELVHVPQEIMGIETPQPVAVKKIGRIAATDINPDRILEADLLRWLFLLGETAPRLVELAKANLMPEHFRIGVCQRLFSLYLKAVEENKPRDLISFAIGLESEEDQSILSEIMQRKINLQKAEEGMIETIRKILQRQWMEKREAVKMQIHSGKLSEDEVLALAKQFDEIKKNPPEVVI